MHTFLLSCRIAAVLIIAIAIGGCQSGSSSVAPSMPTPVAPAPAPAPPRSVPARPFALFGVVTQMAATGRVPVEGVLVEEMTCYLEGCGSNVVQRARTGADGTYRISELYAGRLNFVWITKEGYEPVGMPAVPTCDYCNTAVTLDEDTRLDIELVRR